MEIRIKELTRKVSSLSEIISDQGLPRNSEPSLYKSRYSMESGNPWSLATFQPTIDALKSTDEGYTATEVSEITKRCRNTESEYMNRLFRAGILKRVRKGKKVSYVIADKDKVNSLLELCVI